MGPLNATRQSSVRTTSRGARDHREPTGPEEPDMNSACPVLGERRPLVDNKFARRSAPASRRSRPRLIG
jgi:hypothetical protein